MIAGGDGWSAGTALAIGTPAAYTACGWSENVKSGRPTGEGACATACLSDRIESYLLRRLSEAQALEVQRAELASAFGCAPSQINYVLVTRFTPARGFVVQSRRGGGGFIRLARLPAAVCDAVADLPDSLPQAEAEHHVDRHERAGLLGPREAAMLRAVLSRDVLALPVPVRDALRSAILRAALTAVSRQAPQPWPEAGAGGGPRGGCGSPQGL